MTFRSISLPAFGVAAALLLTGCGGPPADGGSYKNVTELKDAFVKAGGTCDGWEAHNKTILATTSGRCGTKFALGVFADPENMALQVSTFESVHVLAAVGKNWIISGLDAASAHDKLGGELVGKK
jgi:uncharacterized protein YgiB involved in biofilm formation